MREEVQPGRESGTVGGEGAQRAISRGACCLHNSTRTARADTHTGPVSSSERALAADHGGSHPSTRPYCPGVHACAYCGPTDEVVESSVLGIQRVLDLLAQLLLRLSTQTNTSDTRTRESAQFRALAGHLGFSPCPWAQLCLLAFHAPPHLPLPCRAFVCVRTLLSFSCSSSLSLM